MSLTKLAAFWRNYLADVAHIKARDKRIAQHREEVLAQRDNYINQNWQLIKARCGEPSAVYALDQGRWVAEWFIHDKKLSATIDDETCIALELLPKSRYD